MKQPDPLAVKCRALRDAAIADACEPARTGSGLAGLFRLAEIAAAKEPVPVPIVAYILGRGVRLPRTGPV